MGFDGIVHPSAGSRTLSPSCLVHCQCQIVSVLYVLVPNAGEPSDVGAAESRAEIERSRKILRFRARTSWLGSLAADSEGSTPICRKTSATCSSAAFQIDLLAAW